jgi:hypothetical protein
MQVSIDENGDTIMTDEQTITVLDSKLNLEMRRQNCQDLIDAMTTQIEDIDAKLALMDTEVQAGRAVDMRTAGTSLNDSSQKLVAN